MRGRRGAEWRADAAYRDGEANHGLAETGTEGYVAQSRAPQGLAGSAPVPPSGDGGVHLLRRLPGAAWHLPQLHQLPDPLAADVDRARELPRAAARLGVLGLAPGC